MVSAGLDQIRANNVINNIDTNKFSDKKVSDKFDKFAKDKGIKLKLPSGTTIGSPVDGAKTIDITQLIKILYGADDKNEMSHESIGLKPDDVKELKQLLEDNKIVVKKAGIGNSAKKIADRLDTEKPASNTSVSLPDMVSKQMQAQLVIETYNKLNEMIVQMMEDMREIEQKSNEQAQADKLIAEAEAQMEAANEIIKNAQLDSNGISTVSQLNSKAGANLQAAQAIMARLA